MPVPLTARLPVEFTPPSAPAALLEIDPETDLPKLRIYVRVPTPFERDAYHSALVRAGVTQYTRAQVRQIGAAGVAEMFPPEEHEEIYAVLEENWQAQEAEEECAKEQRKRMMELLEEARAKGGEDAVPAPDLVEKELAEIRPEVVQEKGRAIRAISIGQSLAQGYAPMREATAKLIEADNQRAWMNAEIYVSGWIGLEHKPDGNGRGGLTRHEASYLRGQIGKDAFLELSDFISALHGIDEDEEKNLALLLESMSAQPGSTLPVSTASSSDGNSTGGLTTAIPDGAASPTTTGRSSASGSNAKTRKQTASKTGQTDEPTSTSR